MGKSKNGQLYLGIILGFEKKLLLGGGDAALFGEVDEFGNGLSLHLMHDPSTVDFNSLEGSPSLEGNIFTHHPLGYESKNFQFPRRQGHNASLDLCNFGLFFNLNFVF